MFDRFGSVVALLGLLTPLGVSGLAAVVNDLRPGEARPIADFGGQLVSLSGMDLAVAPDGQVYASGFYHGQLVTFMPGADVATVDDGLALVEPWHSFEEDEEGAQDVAVGPDGAVYVAGSETVRRQAPDGTLTIIAGGGAEEASEAVGGPATEAELSPTSVAVGADGSVYVADHSIFKIDSSGTLTRVVETPILTAIGDLAVSPTGGVYFTQSTVGEPDRVALADPDGTVTTVVDDEPAGYAGDGGPAAAARMSEPGKLAFADGRLYVVDTDNQHLRVIDETGVIDTVGSAIPGLRGVAVGPRGALYVATRAGLSMISRDGAEQDPVAPRGDVAPGHDPWAGDDPGATHVSDDLGLAAPKSIAAGRDGILYHSPWVSGEYGESVQRLEVPRGRTESLTAGPAAALATGPDGSVYVAREDTVIRRYRDGREVAVVGGGPDTIDGHRATTVAVNPIAVAVGQDGRLYVLSAETANREAGVVRLNGDGTLTLVVPGAPDTAAIAVAADGTIHLPDEVDNRVRTFTAAGKPAGAEEFAHPTDVAIAADGTRYVADDNGVTEVRPDGDRRSVAEGSVARVAVDPYGNLFLARDKDSALELTVVVRPGEVSTFPWHWVWIGAGVLLVGLGGWWLVRRRRPASAQQVAG